jgi:hypothetical protein
MRCAKCGRLPVVEAPKWALPCMCVIETHAERNARIDVLAAQATAAGHTGLEGLVALAKGAPSVPTSSGNLVADMETMIAAIRNDSLVGRGTCSSIDECWDYGDLMDGLLDHHIETVNDALKWAREEEGLFLEEGLNQRWGEDDDPQLEVYNEFKEKMEKEEKL